MLNLCASFIAAVTIAALGALTPTGSSAAAPPGFPMTIHVSRAESVSAALSNSAVGGAPIPSSDDQTVFLYVTVTNTAPSASGTVLEFNPSDLRLSIPGKSPLKAGSYQGDSPLKSSELFPQGSAGGWTVFTVSQKDLSHLTLVYVRYQKDQQGNSTQSIVASAAIPSVSPSAERIYAARTMPAFTAYVEDEAVAGGYVARLDPLYDANASYGPISSGNRAFLAGQLEQLKRDVRQFNAVKPPSPDSVPTIKDSTAPVKAGAKADTIDAPMAFQAIESDLDSLRTVSGVSAWLAWHSRWVQDSHNLADLYEKWPAL